MATNDDEMGDFLFAVLQNILELLQSVAHVLRSHWPQKREAPVKKNRLGYGLLSRHQHELTEQYSVEMP